MVMSLSTTNIREGFKSLPKATFGLLLGTCRMVQCPLEMRISDEMLDSIVKIGANEYRK